ncbi:hypothetical protein TSUD_273790 [Trifolium subterraneum]|uniref:LisH domain-containing protein n=1 Tax=Trifolium subterraneum TaxID=3900 RepID=A0A2Z6PIC0_TRISU|nr:hypothetical protein TSUD_273790 [Trifolium subterraneum]
MDPIHSPEKLFGNLLYDYLKKKGLSRTAETFLEETQLAVQIPDNFARHPHGFLYRLWTTFCDKYKTRQLIPGTLANPSQAPNIGSIMETTSQMVREGYSIQNLSNGKIVASGGLGEGKPFICNLETRDSVTASESHSLSISEVRFQPKSTIFATSGSKTVKLWNADGLEGSVFDFVGHNGIVRSLDFHPSGGFLCSSDTDDAEFYCSEKSPGELHI